MSESFREKFVSHMKLEAAPKYFQQNALKDVENTIISFFKDIENKIGEEYIKYSNFRISYNIDNNIVIATLGEKFLKFEKSLDKNSIEIIMVKYSDCTKDDKCCSIIRYNENDEDKYCDENNNEINDEKLEYYLEKAFLSCM